MWNTTKSFYAFGKTSGSNKKFQTDLADKIKILKQLKPYVLPFLHQNPTISKSIGKSYFYLAFSKLCFFGGPLLLKNGINGLQSAAFMDPLLLFLGYGICYSGSQLFESMRNLQTAKIIGIALAQTTAKAYQHMLSLDPGFFFSGSQRHKLFNLTKAQSSLQQNIKSFTQYFLPIILDIVMSISMLLYYSGSYFVLSFICCYGAYSVFTIKYSDYRKKDIRLVNQAQKEIDFITSETFANYFNVKYFQNQKIQLDKYKKAIEKFYQRKLTTQTSLGILNSLQRIIFGAGLTFNMILAAYYTQLGILSTGDIIMIQTLMLQFLNPLFFLGTMYRFFTDSFVFVKELNNVLEMKPKVKQGQKQLKQCKGNIQLKNVKFQYSDGSQVIENISIEIKQNQFVALIGPSGSGKTTILHLIFRLYDTSEGQILIDEHNIRDLKFNFRNHIAFVSQSPYLFNGTVMQNLKYANPEATQQQIFNLAKQLDIHEIIMDLPQQYNTNVGQKGSIFSGGQKQRISLIRALLKKSKIILLDQPTSSLDPVTENKVGQIIKRHTQCTRIMITHRQKTASFADRIIDMSKF